jgi:hypothetical protein
MVSASSRILVDFAGSKLVGFGFSLLPEKKHANDAAYDGDSYKYREHNI